MCLTMRIFVSYSKQDYRRVAALVRSLEGEGWTVFWDTQILPGNHWSEEIEGEIAAADCMVVVWSKTAAQSRWVAREASVARSTGKPIVQVSLDGTLPAPGFGDLQFEDLSWWNRWWSRRGENAALRRAVITIWRKIAPQAHGAQLPLPPDEPWINSRTISAASALVLAGVALYWFGHDPLYGYMRRQTLAHVENWWIQLSGINPEESGFLNPNDMLVLYYTRDNSTLWQRGTEAPTLAGPARDKVDAVPLTRADVKTLRTRTYGDDRLLIAYLSIGKAEIAAPYWNPEWVRDGKPTEKAPPWLIRQDPMWNENFEVRFWSQDWLKELTEGDGSYLSTVMAQGFDGVLFDDLDIYKSVEAARPSAKRDMIELVRGLAAAAHKRNPRFVVLVQNAEALLEDRDYVDAIDGVVREDLLFALGPDNKLALRPTREVEEIINRLHRAQTAGRPVFVVEYLKSAAQTDFLRRALIVNGFKPLITDRSVAKSSGLSLRDFLTQDADGPQPPAPK